VLRPLACLLIVAGFVFGSAGCSDASESQIMIVEAEAGSAQRAAAANVASDDDLSPRVLRRFVALEAAPQAGDSAIADIGRLLYYDTRLSKSGDVSCNTCHPLDKYGTTADRVSTGVFGRKGVRNAPSTYHASGHFAQMWDGRSPSVEAQAMMPIENREEMGLSPAEAVAAIDGIPGYRARFAAAFADDVTPVTFARIGVALGAFERGLVTPARWDRYLRGDSNVLTAREKAGAKLFANLGCIVCHTGPYVGGSMFEHLGARVPWPASTDRGRKTVTGLMADDMVFKVPSLRNVAKTAPYFHDGSAPTLEVAVRMMARHQLGVELEDDEVRELEAWLGSLTGEIPTEYIKQPELPPEV
jgi:cytochrome c peroxidase